MVFVDNLVRHPRGEDFVKPNIVPPSCSNQVAEPLMCQFMSDHAGGIELPPQRNLFRFDKEESGPVRDQPLVLHRWSPTGPDSSLSNRKRLRCSGSSIPQI